MLKFLLIIMWFCEPFLVNSQNSFFKTFDFGIVDDAYQILSYNSRIYVSCASWCGVECSYISEIDINGNILWRTELPDIDIGQSTIVIINDTLTVTGNNDIDNSTFRMAHFTMDGVKIGETVEIEHPIKKFTRMFQLTTPFYNDKYILCGSGKMDNIYNSLIYVVNKTGYIDTLIVIEPTDKVSVLWDSYIDNVGHLTTFHWIQKDEPDSNYRIINKFDQNFNKVWTYKSEDNNANYTVPRACELEDGRIVLAYTNPIGGFYLHSVRAINPNGSLSWQYDYQWYGSRTREIRKIKKLRNGDIMGSGRYSELEQIPRIGDSPWLFRMSPDGELLWEHTYYELDSTLGENGNSRVGTLFDFIELENGDIMAVGNFRYNDNDMLIMRVDSNGCLDSKDCHDVNIPTATEDLNFIQNDFNIYPNPGSEIINIEVKSDEYLLNIEVHDITGQKVAAENIINGYAQLNISQLKEGIYIILIMREKQLLKAKKFVKLNT